MEREKKKWSDLAIKEKRKIILLFAGIILASAMGISFRYFMDIQSQDYTIGTIDDIYKPARGNTRVSFIYFVNGQEHQSTGSLYGYEDIVKVGETFLVEYPEEYPWRGKIHLKIDINDTISAPDKGWDEVPSLLKRIH